MRFADSVELEKGFPICSYYNPVNLHHAGPRLPSEPGHNERQANFEIGLYDHLKKRKRRFAGGPVQPDVLFDQLKLVNMLPANGSGKELTLTYAENLFFRRN